MTSFINKALLAGFLLMLLNSAYLFSYGEPTIFYLGNVMLHVVLGVVLIVPFLIFLRRHGRLSTGKSGGLAGIVAIVSGLWLMVVGATTPNRWLLITHIVTSIVCVASLVAHLVRTAGPSGPVSPRAARMSVAVLVFALIFPALARTVQHYRPNPDYLVYNPASPPTSMYEEGGGTDGPFFPASVETDAGDLIPTDFFLTSETCAESGCHPDIFDQWNESAHHFSSFNNQWYRKSVMYMQDVNGIQPSKWCGGCHDLAVLLNGVMDRPIRDNIHTPAAQAGISCTGCHSIERVKDTMGNNGFVIKYPPLHDVAASDNPIVKKLHNYLIRLDPEPHRKSFLKPFHRDNGPEFCSPCHKAHLDEPVNNFRWLRGFNEYDAWQSSGVSHQGALSFYYPPEPRGCADCHMPLVPSNDAANVDGNVHSHRFPAANTALPHVNQYPDQLQATTAFLKGNKVSVDIFALAPPIEANAGHAVASVTDIARVVAPIDKARATVPRGREVRVDVVVRTLDVGHRFPGGTIDAFDVWVELKATDENGKAIFWSGQIEAEDGNGPVDPAAHFYGSYMLDEHGNKIDKRNAWAARTVLYSRTIPPGAADTIHYRLFVPEDSGSEIHIEARLNYRKFDWWNTQWAYAGVRDPDHTDFAVDKGYDDGRWVFTGRTDDVAGKIKAIPNLPIVTMAEDRVTLRVIDGAKEASGTRAPQREDRQRWNDYGIGLLLQGDLKGAEKVFLRVTEIDPDYMDGWVNVARCRIQEGNLAGAEEMLKRAFEIQKTLAPNDPHRGKVHYFYALALKAYGEYDEALEHLRTAAEQFPRDKIVRNEIGRLLYLQRNYQDALTEFQKTLEVDPENLDAHYNMMLCYRGLKDEVAAAREQKLYLRFKADESKDAITGITRRADPEANIERQQIHEHTSSLGAKATGYDAQPKDMSP